MYKTFFTQVKIALLVLLILIPAGTYAQDTADLAGKWKVNAKTDGGVEVYTWTVKQSGKAYSGHIIKDEAEEGYDLDTIEVEGKKVTFEFAAGDSGYTAEVKLELVAAGKMNGKFSIGNGSDVVASGTIEASKVAKKMEQKKSTQLAGQWDTVALLPDGNEMESKLMLQDENGKLSGVVTSTDSENSIDEITVDGKSAKFVLAVEVGGNEIDIVIEAELVSDDSLVGQWSLMQGETAAQSGAWSAKRVRSAAPETSKKEIVLFDGSSLDSFRGYAKEEIGDGWRIVDGTLHLKPGKKKAGDIVTKEQYGSFELEFDWKVSAGGNSGVMYRVSLDKKRPWHTGPEYQVLDDSAHKDGKTPNLTAGSIYALYPPVGKTLKPVGEWNSSKIVLDGNKLEHWLNGTKVAESELGSDEWNEKVAASKFNKQADFGKMKKGHICFQDHGNRVWFRNIKIKPLD